MAIYYARKSGNVNATDVWATTPSGTAGDFFSSFTSQDTLISNNFTITLNVNTTVLEVRTDTTGGATAGGSFTLNNGITLTANVIAGSTNNCVNYSGASPNSATIVGSITGGNGSVQSGAVVLGGTGTLNIIGNIIGGTGSTSWGINSGSNPIVNITGNVTGGSGTNAYGINMYVALFTVNVTGIVTGGTGPTAHGIFVSSSAGAMVVNVIGTALGGNINTAIQVSSTSSTITATRAKGNGFGNGSVGMVSVVGITNSSQSSLVRVYEIEYGTLGQSPTSGPIELITANSNVAVFATRFESPKTLVDLNNAVNLVPSSGNVRSGVSYNYGNDIGSCVVPNPNSVVYGVPVDATIGSGLLSPVAVWNALTSSIGTSGTIGERLKNCSTVSTVGKQLEGVL